MVHVSTLVAALGCMLASSSSLFVSGSPTTGPRRRAEAALPDSYTLTPIEWRGELEAGGPLVYLSGDSFEDIEVKAKALNPAYTIFGEAPAVNETAALVARQTQMRNCGQPSTWSWAPDANEAWVGALYLRGITGDCRADPRSCGRVSCSWDNAIYYCNDNNAEHWEPCRWIGEVASDIISNCHGMGFEVKGQSFDLRNWNTIVAWGDC